MATDCSECGIVLDQFKYICTTCGEKPPVSRTVLAGEYHHRGNSTEYEPQGPSDPPRAHRGPVTLYTSNTNLPHLSSRSILVPPSPSGSSSLTAHVGYELCHTCFGETGCNHALPVSVGSPKLPPTLQELAIARRSAPKRKGDLRHAFLYQIWSPGFGGWQDVGDFPLLL